MSSKMLGMTSKDVEGAQPQVVVAYFSGLAETCFRIHSLNKPTPAFRTLTNEEKFSIAQRLRISTQIVPLDSLPDLVMQL